MKCKNCGKEMHLNDEIEFWNKVEEEFQKKQTEVDRNENKK